MSALGLVTAGESHGPALVASSRGCRPGSCSPEEIRRDLLRRQQGYGRSPRQQIETDYVEMVGGLRHGRTLGRPIALLIRNREHANWGWV